MRAVKPALDAQKQAREAIKYWNASYSDGCPHPLGIAALNALEISITALEAVQTDPVAWIVSYDGKLPYSGFSQDRDYVENTCKHIGGSARPMALYATPQQAAPAWKPIDSAPTDGTFFLATDGTTFKVLNWPPNHYLGVWDWNDKRQQWRGAGDSFINPTHWMPLPTPPKATA